MAPRIHGDIDPAETYRLKTPQLPLGGDLGSLQGATSLSRVTLHFKLSPQQQQQLAALIRAQADPRSPKYKQWLSAAQFRSQFGLNSTDSEKIQRWLENTGMHDLVVSANGTYIQASGSADAAEQAFHTALHRFSNGHYAPVSPIEIPQQLASVVADVRGLSDAAPLPHLRPRYVSSTTGSHYLQPSDFTTIYDLAPLYGQGVDGAGQTIAVIGQSDIDLTRVARFRSAAGLSASTPQVMLSGPDPGSNTKDQTEGELGMEWAGAVAPGAKMLYVEAANAADALIYAIDNKVASVILMNFGACEANYSSTIGIETELQKAAAEGITVITSSGDMGAADCDASLPATHGLAVDYPSSSAYVLSVGGTALNAASSYWSSAGSPVGYIPESAWGDTSGASGGGTSNLFTKPSWQSASGANRMVPDVALAASVAQSGYLVCAADSDCTNGFRGSDGTLHIEGGTSVAAAAFAGIVALLNQSTGVNQGFLNKQLYSLASISQDVFHDITTGGNSVACAAGSPACVNGNTSGYSAAVGYDAVTGLGSVDAGNFISEWNSGFSLSGPSALTVTGSSSSSATIQVNSAGGFAGTVTFTCALSASLQQNLSCTIPGSVTKAGTLALSVGEKSQGQVLPVAPIHFGRLWILPLLCTLSFLVTLRRLPRKSRLVAAGVAICCLSGCGGGGGSTSSQTPTQTPVATSQVTSGTVTVTGSSGDLQQSTTIPVSWTH